MYRYVGDFDRTLDLMAHLRRQMDTVFDDYSRGQWSQLDGRAFPPTNLYDTGSALVLKAEVPGLGESDIELTLNRDVLTIAGARKVDAPEGYSTHRSERANLQFSRSYSLPVQIDPEKVTATTKDGILTVTLEKAAEVKPRQITVKVN